VVRECEISEIFGMVFQYGDKYVIQKKVYEWVEIFKGGKRNLHNEELNNLYPSSHI
jgi:hypothetical protein